MKKKNLDFIKKIINFFRKKQKMFFVVFSLFFTPFSFIFGEDGLFGGFMSIVYGTISAITGLIKTFLIWILYAVSLIFDNMVAIGISREFYQLNWIKLVWGVTRDLANIAFIAGIIVIGYLIIFGKDYWRSKFINLIIIAFIINFSLFFGKVIIDAGNFATAIFYSMTAVESAPASDQQFDRFLVSRTILKLGDNQQPFFGNRSIATGLIAYMNPMSIYGPEELQKQINENDDGNLDENIKKMKIILDIFFSLLIFKLSKSLLEASYMFVMRMISLIYYLISSPVFFAWYFLPKGDKKLTEWFEAISRKSFCMTTYMIGMWCFFLFLGASGNWFDMTNNGGLLMLSGVLGIKFIIITIALDVLNGNMVKECADGKGLTSTALNTALKIATKGMGGKLKKFVPKKMISRIPANISRNIIGNTGKRVGDYAQKMHTSSNWLVRKGGGLAQNIKNNLYNKKIFNKSYKEAVQEKINKESSIIARLSENDRKKRFYYQQGGKKIRFKQSDEDIKKHGNLNDFSNLSEKERIDRVWKNNHKILSKSIIGTMFANASPDKKSSIVKTGIREGVKVGAKIVDKTADSFAGVFNAPSKDASSQYLKTLQMETKSKEQKLKEQNKLKQIEENYLDKKKEITRVFDEKEMVIKNAKKKLENNKDIKKYLEKIVEIWDESKDGSSAIKNQLEKAIKKNNLKEMVDVLKKSKIGEDIKNIDNKKINEYENNFDTIEHHRKNINKLRVDLVQQKDTQSREKIKTNIKNSESTIEILEKGIKDILVPFAKMSDKKSLNIKKEKMKIEEKNKQYYDDEKKIINETLTSIDTILKENKDDIATGNKPRHANQ